MNRIGRPTLVLSLLLASVPWCLAADQDPDQASAIADIKKLGGRLLVDEKSSDKPTLLADLGDTKEIDLALERLKGLTQLKGLSLHGPLVTDATLMHLKALPQLTWLSLEGTRVTDAGLVDVTELAQLQFLGLASTKVTDAGLVHLKGLTKLQWLSLGNTQVTDAGLVYLKGLNEPQGLHLAGTQVTDAGVKDLEKALPKVKIERR